jgi:hypothetical protein
MSEDRFFKQVNATMTDFRPEVPEAVYVGMRKKLWWSNFTRLSATRFNIWYVAVLFLTAGVVFSRLYSENEVAVSPVIQLEPDAVALPAAETPSQIPAQSKTASEQSSEKKTGDKHALTNNDSATSEMVSIETSSERVTTTQQEVVQVPDAQEASATKETELESTQANKASRKGLKVKTFNSGEKKD